MTNLTNMPTRGFRDLPPDLVDAVFEMTTRWQKMAFDFLESCRELLLAGGRDLDSSHFMVSPMQVLEIGAVMQLFEWEQQGIFVHVEAGLPYSVEAMNEHLKGLKVGKVPSEFLWKFLKVWVERFAWCGRADLGADVTLDDLNDDASLDALAELLWAHRHDGPTADDAQL